MTSLEKQKKELELARVTLAKKELEFKILEREEEISRLKEHISVQDKKISELTLELGQ